MDRPGEKYLTVTRTPGGPLVWEWAEEHLGVLSEWQREFLGRMFEPCNEPAHHHDTGGTKGTGQAGTTRYEGVLAAALGDMAGASTPGGGRRRLRASLLDNGGYQPYRVDGTGLVPPAPDTEPA